MLHELLLLALLGYTGDFVIDEREQSKAFGIDDPQIASGEPSFKLAVDLSFIQPSERSAIERLKSLGFYYGELNRFATVSRNLTLIQTTKYSPTQQTSGLTGISGKSSVYRRAIANGIVEIFSVYKAAILQVEQNLLSDPVPILSTVAQGLSKFDVLLPPLYDLVVEIEQGDIRGGQLLNLLYKQCHCGVPELQACIQRSTLLISSLAFTWLMVTVLSSPLSFGIIFNLEVEVGQFWGILLDPGRTCLGSGLQFSPVLEHSLSGIQGGSFGMEFTSSMKFTLFCRLSQHVI